MSYIFPYLIDGPEDGIIEANGHVPGDSAATPEEAAAEFRRRYVAECGEAPWEDERQTLVGRERLWMRPLVYAYSDGPCAPTEEDLNDNPESVRFYKCEPTDEGAQEWWRVELVQACAKQIEETEAGDLIFCTLPSGHDGVCSPPEGASDARSS